MLRTLQFLQVIFFWMESCENKSASKQHKGSHEEWAYLVTLEAGLDDILTK